MRECQLASEAIVKWRNLCRDICAEYFIQHPIALGGPGVVVEIDESAFVRRKHHAGYAVNTQWVFGGIEVSSKNCFLVAVESRTAVTLLPNYSAVHLRGKTGHIGHC